MNKQDLIIFYGKQNEEPVLPLLQKNFNLIDGNGFSPLLVTNNKTTNIPIFIYNVPENNETVSLLLLQNIKAFGSPRYSKLKQALILDSVGIKHSATFGFFNEKQNLKNLAFLLS